MVREKVKLKKATTMIKIIAYLLILSIVLIAMIKILYLFASQIRSFITSLFS